MSDELNEMEMNKHSQGDENEKVIINCNSLSQFFDDAGQRVSIFEELDFSLKQGESIAITGASGSGKSTLLYLLGGLEKPKSGSIEISGIDIASLSSNKLAKFRNQKLGFVYQFHHLLTEFTALENVSMPLLIRGDNTAIAMDCAKEMLAQVGLSHRLNHKPATMSGGERQRTAIARALVTQPDCILADEPTGNLDHKTAQQVYDLLLELNQKYKTSLIVVTHDLELASKMQRQVVLREGKLIDSRDKLYPYQK